MNFLPCFQVHVQMDGGYVQHDNAQVSVGHSYKLHFPYK